MNKHDVHGVLSGLVMSRHLILARMEDPSQDSNGSKIAFDGKSSKIRVGIETSEVLDWIISVFGRRQRSSIPSWNEVLDGTIRGLNHHRMNV